MTTESLAPSAPPSASLPARVPLRVRLPAMLRRLGFFGFLGVCCFGGGAVGVLWSARGQPGGGPAAGAGHQHRPASPQRPLRGGSAAGFSGGRRRRGHQASGTDGKRLREGPLRGGVGVRRPGPHRGQRGVFVLTNNHVIAQTAPQQISVSLADGRLLRPVQVLADPESDVAVLRIENGEGLTTAPLGDSDRVRVGQWVLAIGSPFGLDQTVTHGIISAASVGRSVWATPFASRISCRPTRPSIPVPAGGRSSTWRAR